MNSSYLKKFFVSKIFALFLLTTMGLNFSAFAGWDEGVAAFMGKNYKEAAKQFNIFVQQKPNSDKGHYMLGLSLYRLNQKVKAQTHLRKAYDLNPNDLSIKVALGRALIASGKYKAAFIVLGESDMRHEQLRRISAELGAGFNDSPAEAFYLYGTTAQKLGKNEEALKAFKKATELAPGNGTYLKAYKAAQ